MRKNQSLQRKIAMVMCEAFSEGIYDAWNDSETNQKVLAKLIKKVIRSHNAGK